MNRNKIARIGAIVMILSMLLTIFIGAMSIKAATQPGLAIDAVPGLSLSHTTPVVTGVNPDIDGDGILNNEDGDIDGDGIDNGLDPDIDGDGIPNTKDGNPASTNNVDSVPPKDVRTEATWQWIGGSAVLAVLGSLVALPYLRKRKGTSSRSVGNRG
jgi:hypothetical protein